MGGPEGFMVDIHIDTGRVIAPVDLGIWREGESIDVRLDVYEWGTRARRSM